jgi:hypothetical protein
MFILSRAKSLFLRGDTDPESFGQAASKRNYRRLAQQLSSETTLTEVSDLASSAGLNPAILSLAALRRLEAVGS